MDGQALFWEEINLLYRLVPGLVLSGLGVGMMAGLPGGFKVTGLVPLGIGGWLLATQLIPRKQLEAEYIKVI